jgi:hypothetical protein
MRRRRRRARRIKVDETRRNHRKCCTGSNTRGLAAGFLGI